MTTLQFALAALIGGLCAHWFIGTSVVPCGMVCGVVGWYLYGRLEA